MILWFSSYTIICPRFNEYGETGFTLTISAGSKKGNMLSPLAVTSVVLPDLKSFISICRPFMLLSSKFTSYNICYFCGWFKSYFINRAFFCNVCYRFKMFTNHIFIIKKLNAVRH